MAVERANGETYPSEESCRKELVLQLLYGSLGYRILIVILDPISIERRWLRRSSSFAKALNPGAESVLMTGRDRPGGVTQYTTVSKHLVGTDGVYPQAMSLW